MQGNSNREATRRKNDRRNFLIMVGLCLLTVAIVGGVLGHHFRAMPVYFLHHYPKVKSNNLIRFSPGRISTYRDYVNDILVKLEAYLPAHQDHVADVAKCPGNEKPYPGVQCYFDVGLLGPSCTTAKHFGYYSGSPCVILEFQAEFDWIPVDFSEDTPVISGVKVTPGHVAVECSGETAADQDNLGKIQYYPSTGFAFKFFPNNKSVEYIAPLVMVEFVNPVQGLVLFVRCSAWPANPSASKEMYTTYFRLFVD